MGVFYLTMPGKNAEGWAGRDFFLGSKSMLKAIDYQTGKTRWEHTANGRGGQSGILTTAGHLLFTSDDAANLVASMPPRAKSSGTCILVAGWGPAL